MQLGELLSEALKIFENKEKLSDVETLVSAMRITVESLHSSTAEKVDFFRCIDIVSVAAQYLITEECKIEKNKRIKGNKRVIFLSCLACLGKRRCFILSLP